VAIARAHNNDPAVLLADEPTGTVDAEAAEEVKKLLLRLRERGATILIATHDRQMIERYGTRILRLERGALIGDLARGSGG
jgi:cell division transport system ATP-binding protein